MDERTDRARRDRSGAVALSREGSRNATALRAAIARQRPAVVIFDVFDTLLVRDVHPEDVKRLFSRELAAHLDLRSGWRELYALRAELEQQLARERAQAGHDDEFRFVDLTERLHQALATGHPEKLPPRDRFCELALDVELGVERAVQSPDGHVVDCLRQLHKDGTEIVLLSDFYLPASAVGQLLAWQGIPDTDYDRLLVSADIGRTKRTGRLYDVLLETAEAEPGAMLMVGDNAHADEDQAVRHGIPAVLLERSARRRRYEGWARRMESPEQAAAALRRLVPLLRREVPFFPELALTLSAFTLGLRERLVADGTQDVFFLSREGQFLRRLFELAQDETGVVDGRRIRTHYLQVSRRSTFLASLGPLADEPFESLFRQYRATSVGHFLCSLGFSTAEAEAIGGECGVDIGRVHEDLPTSAAFARLRAAAAFQTRYEERRRRQRDLLRAYVAGFGAGTDTRPLTLVDVGWKGTIQDHLSRALRPPHGIDGYYVGLVAAGEAHERNRKHGVLFDVRRPHPVDAFYNENRSLFEVVLAADHPSVREYAHASGAAEPVLEEQPDDVALYTQVMAPLQARLLRACRPTLRLLWRVADEGLGEQVARRHARMVLFPRRREKRWFRGLTHRENFGVFEHSRFFQEHRPPVTARLANARAVLRDPRAVARSSFWFRLTLDDLGLEPLGVAYGCYRYVAVRLRSRRP